MSDTGTGDNSSGPIDSAGHPQPERSATQPSVPLHPEPQQPEPQQSVPHQSIPPSPEPTGVTPQRSVPRSEGAAPAAETIYVNAPSEPVARGNRGFGVIVTVIATIVFAAAYGVIIVILEAINSSAVSMAFLSDRDFYIPVAFFLVGFLVLALLANRAGWWVYVFASLLVGLFVYFGTVGMGLLLGGVVLETPDGASRLFGEALMNPYVIAAALMAREVALWLGSAVAARGRRVKQKNALAREAFEKDSSEAMATHRSRLSGADQRDDVPASARSGSAVGNDF